MVNLLQRAVRRIAQGAVPEHPLRFNKGAGKSGNALLELVVGQRPGQGFQNGIQRMNHMFQRQFGQRALKGVDGRGHGGNFQIWRGGTEMGRGVRIKIQFHAVLAGDQALQLQTGAQTALNHAADDFLLE